jgi:hypothetical protein
MAKGHKTGGRRAGTPNRVTADFKAAVSKLADKIAPDLEAWLLEIKDPAKRIDSAVRLFEYAYPKFSRTELSGPDGGALTIVKKVYSWEKERVSARQTVATPIGAPPQPQAASDGTTREVF